MGRNAGFRDRLSRHWIHPPFSSSRSNFGPEGKYSLSFWVGPTTLPAPPSSYCSPDASPKVKIWICFTILLDSQFWTEPTYREIQVCDASYRKCLVQVTNVQGDPSYSSKLPQVSCILLRIPSRLPETENISCIAILRVSRFWAEPAYREIQVCDASYPPKLPQVLLSAPRHQKYAFAAVRFCVFYAFGLNQGTDGGSKLATWRYKFFAFSKTP